MGKADLTADVDFAACAKAAKGGGALSLPLTTQGGFLMSMGILERVQVLPLFLILIYFVFWVFYFNGLKM